MRRLFERTTRAVAGAFHPSLRFGSAQRKEDGGPEVAAATMHIAAVGTALPPHRYDQETLVAGFRSLWPEGSKQAHAVERLQRATQVRSRHLALPIERYLELRDFGEANDEFIRAAVDLGERALRSALAAAGLEPRDVDAIFFTTVTGIANPSIDARLVNRVGLRPDVKRLPIFGLGCVAGAAGIARMADYLRAYPQQVAVLLSVELCSLTLQRRDDSIANIIAGGLFGDGAAAVVGVGGARARATGVPTPRVLASRSGFYPATEHLMGWKIGAEGFRIVLDAAVPAIVRTAIGPDVKAFLATRGLAVKDIATWVCHPGGPKVLEAFQDALGIGERETALSWRSLAEIGNLSSASVLHVLAATLAERRMAGGARGVIAAMGPGFCSEVVVFEW